MTGLADLSQSFLHFVESAAIAEEKIHKLSGRLERNRSRRPFQIFSIFVSELANHCDLTL